MITEIASVAKKPIIMHLKFKYSYFLLPCLTAINIVGELGHFLIGVVSRSVAQDIGYGDKGCLPTQNLSDSIISVCRNLKNETSCNAARVTIGNVSQVQGCQWDYTGLGTEYQILAGPSYTACFTVAGILWGYLGDRFNRAWLLGVSAIACGVAISGTAFASQYWHLILFRMTLASCAAACLPIATAIIGDVYSEDKRAFAMSILITGLYFGYGASFAIGSYVTDDVMFGKKWQTAYVVSGVPGIVVGILFLLIMTKPKNSKKESLKTEEQNEKEDIHSSVQVISNTDIQDDAKLEQVIPEKPHSCGSQIQLPVTVIFVIAACIRHTAGCTWGYNVALYFQTYFPAYDSGWWLTEISIGGGIFGLVFGGYLSDSLVWKYGTSNRALVLVASQLLSTPFAMATLYTEPPYSFIFLLGGVILSEMWFGIMHALLVEIAPNSVTAVAVALFVILNAGGNLPMIVDPLSARTDYRTALAILFPGGLLTSSILFFLCWLLLRTKV